MCLRGSHHRPPGFPSCTVQLSFPSPFIGQRGLYTPRPTLLSRSSASCYGKACFIIALSVLSPLPLQSWLYQLIHLSGALPLSLQARIIMPHCCDDVTHYTQPRAFWSSARMHQHRLGVTVFLRGPRRRGRGTTGPGTLHSHSRQRRY